MSLLASSPLASAGPLRVPEPAATPIVGGEPTGDGAYESVVALISDGHPFCTGTAVAPRLVLTAAHCVIDVRRLRDLEVIAGASVLSGRRLDVAAIGFTPEYDPVPTHVDVHDFGYVLLAEDFSPRDGFVSLIAAPEEWDEVMQPGQVITLVGYGEDPTVSGYFRGSGIKRMVETTIRQLTPQGLEFFAGGAQLDSCDGDSGGPAFARVSDGTRRLIGVTSRGSEPCGDGGYYGVPYAAACWLRDETGIDLTAPGCEQCDCIDTAPPADNGCGVADDRSARGMIALVVVVLGSWTRRRRRSCTSQES